MKANFCTQTENGRFFENAPVLTFYNAIWKFTFLFHKSVLWLLYLLLIKPSFNATSSLYTWRPSARMKLILISSSWRTLLKSAENFISFYLLTLGTLENSLITAPNFLTIIQALLHQSCLCTFSLVLIFLF